MEDRSDIYVRFEQVVGDRNWRNLAEARFYQRFRKDVFNMCRQLGTKTLEEFFAGDTEYLPETSAIDLEDADEEDYRHKWFAPDEALPIVIDLKERMSRNQAKPFAGRLLTFLDDLISCLEAAKTASTRFHLYFQ